MRNVAIEAAHKALKNNAKETLMTEAIAKFGGKRDGARNVIIWDDGTKTSVSVSAGYKAEARQHYDDINGGLLTYSVLKSQWYRIPEADLERGNPTRISVKGNIGIDVRGEFLKTYEV